MEVSPKKFVERSLLGYYVIAHYERSLLGYYVIAHCKMYHHFTFKTRSVLFLVRLKKLIPL
jgi:hypothetical protein